nr:hypothetical protein [Rhizobium sp. ACO-34A]
MTDLSPQKPAVNGPDHSARREYDKVTSGVNGSVGPNWGEVRDNGQETIEQQSGVPPLTRSEFRRPMLQKSRMALLIEGGKIDGRRYLNHPFGKALLIAS